MDLKTDVEKTIVDGLVQSAQQQGFTPEHLKEELNKVLSSDHTQDSVYLSVSLSVGDVLRPDSHGYLHLDGMQIHTCPSSVLVVYSINDEYLDHIYPKPYVKDKHQHKGKVFGVVFLEYEDVSKHDNLSLIDLMDYNAVHYYTQPVDIITLTLHCSYVGNIRNNLNDAED